jgi:SAM-dependent methyltransferase
MGSRDDSRMTTTDQFSDLSRHYDAIMREVDYDRWVVVASLLADVASSARVRHVDLACGTGRLLKRLVQHGWSSVGIDLSHGMLRQSRRGPYVPAVAVADLAALPFPRRFNYATCVFDSVNFMLETERLHAAFRAVANVLTEGGVFYFDVITERMVTKHFANREWTEDNGGFSTSWSGKYDRRRRMAELQIRVNTGMSHRVLERVYTHEEVVEAVESAGLELLGDFDSETWAAPSPYTTRIDYVAARAPSRTTERKFEQAAERVRQALGA